MGRSRSLRGAGSDQPVGIMAGIMIRARLDVSLTISLNLEPFGLVRQVCIGKGFAELN